MDNIVGTSGNDTINATNTSSSVVLGGLDVVDGGGGTDTLNIADTATASSADLFLPTGFTIKNVEALSIVTNGAIGTKSGTAFDISGVSGLTSATLTAAGAGTASGSNVKAANTTDVTLTVAGSNQIDITGGKVVTTNNGGIVNVTGSGLTAVTVNKAGGTVTIDNVDASSTSAAGTTLKSVTLASVDANSAVKGKAIETLAVSGATTAARTVTVTNSTANHTLTVNVDGTGYNTVGTEVQTVVVDANAKTIAVNATGAKSSLALTGSSVVTTLNITGSAALKQKADDLSTLTTIDGSAATGNLTLGDLNAATVNVKTGAGNDSFAIQATSKVTVDTGAGNDTVTLKSALAAGSTVSLGDGNDKLLFATGGSVAVSTSTVIDAGAGNDSLSANLLTAGNAGQFKNFELINLDSTTGLDLALLSGNNTLTGLTMSSTSTTATYQNVSKAFGLTIDFVGDNSAVTNTLQFKDASGTADDYTITFAGSASSAPSAANVKAGTLVLGGIETINIVSGGTNAWNAVALKDDAAAQKVVVTGAANLDLTFAGTFGSTSSPNTGVSLIDGSAATGKLSINTTNVTAATAGLTVKGGSAADTITLAQKATVDAGAGNDTVIVSASGGTITTGAGTDVVNVKAAVASSISAPVITTITDFAVSTDKLTLKDQGTETFTATKVDVSSATALFGGTTNALDLALAGDGSTNAAVKWFQFAGDTYVVQDLSAAATFATTDIVVKITGLVDLSGLAVTDFNFA